LRKVKTFTEKPNLELAKVFVESGEFFWNAGIFLWNLQTIDKAFKELLPEMAQQFEAGASLYGTDKEQAFINEVYPACQNISIDYGIMEKAPNVNVLAAEFGWSDLGTWGSLYELSPKDKQHNATLKCQATYYESENNIVTLPSGKLAVIEGLNGYIVAEEDDALLICRKESEQHIRQIVNDITANYGGKFI
jgi:mannose-1-phosphate guanylyltransferase